jgi:hypothetical protein
LVCATHAPPWQRSGTVLFRQRRPPSSQPHTKFKSSRQIGVSPVQLVAGPQLPSAAQPWALFEVWQWRSLAAGSHAVHSESTHWGVVPEQVSVVCQAPWSSQLCTWSLKHWPVPPLHLPQVFVLSRHAGFCPLQLSITSKPLPSALHCSTALSAQCFSAGVQGTQLPSKQAAFGLVQAPWLTHSPASLQSCGPDSEHCFVPGLHGLHSPATQNVPLSSQDWLWSHFPCSLQLWDSLSASGLQRLVSGMHSPMHALSRHKNSHSVWSTYSPPLHCCNQRSPLH